LAIADFTIAIGAGVQQRLETAVRNARLWPQQLPLPELQAEQFDAGTHASIASVGAVSWRSTDGAQTIALVHSASAGFDADLRDQLHERLAAGLPPRVHNAYSKFVAAHVDVDGNAVFCTDPMRGFALFYAEVDGELVVATDMRVLMSVAGLYTVDSQSLFHYLNFAQVPTPHTLINGIRKLAPGEQLCWRNARATTSRYWQPSYGEDLTLSEDAAADELFVAMQNAVDHCRPEHGHWGCFLSGGNDSSTITGLMSQLQEAPVRSYSIGFEEQGYDELPWALAAADAFSCDAQSRRISAADAFAAIGKLSMFYDEPFGNASAIPTYFCTLLATEQGVSTMIAGDGGDEIFGGNERYSKDAIFQQYYRLPGFLKRLLRYSADKVPIDDWRFWNRVRNFVYRASLPNPERFYTDDAFASEFFDELLTQHSRDVLQRESSLAIMQKHFDEVDAASELHRLMYIDLQLAICDNDLTKVNRAAKGAGVSVLYPFLSPELIQFTGRLPARFKVNGTRKRVLFSAAAKRILPEVIQNKPKQGFGLPVSVWLREHADFRALAHDTLLAANTDIGSYVNTDFIGYLLEKHDKGAWDYSQEIWMLLMLERWLKENSHGAA
jgi:asparagine synthase (glutamine-hydrolysing)